MIQEMVFCTSCSQMFDLKTCEQIYMCGDIYVCSKSCSEKRLYELRIIDPGLAHPDTWYLINSENPNPLFNPKLISKATKNTLSNLDKEDTVYLTIENMMFESKKEQQEYNELFRNRNNRFCLRYFGVGISFICIIFVIVVSII